MVPVFWDILYNIPLENKLLNHGMRHFRWQYNDNIMSFLCGKRTLCNKK